MLPAAKGQGDEAAGQGAIEYDEFGDPVVKKEKKKKNKSKKNRARKAESIEGATFGLPDPKRPKTDEE
jgi:hypothetical protein